MFKIDMIRIILLVIVVVSINLIIYHGYLFLDFPEYRIVISDSFYYKG